MRKFLALYITPLLWKYFRKSKRHEIFKEMQKLQWETLEDNLNLQKKKLYKILDYSIKNIPYYKKIANENNIKLTESSVFKDIKKFPILTKEIIRKNFRDLMDNSVSAIENSSGGSTGEPIIFMQDNSMIDFGEASKFLFKEWTGRKSGDLLIKLWGSERDILEGGYGLSGFLTINFLNTLNLNTFRMSSTDIEKYINIINKKRPSLILAYVQSAYEIAKYAKKNNLKINSPKAVMTSAGTLYVDFKKLIENVFGCKVFNRYGSREVGDMACDCEFHSGLHLNIFCHFFEILNNDLSEVSAGESGDVYVTTLENYAMPLIRYKIGDVAETAESFSCACKRGLPIIKSIKGRDVNLFKLRDGSVIDGEYFTHLFYFKKWIKKFQVIQKDFGLIEINIVLSGIKKDMEIKKIEKDIRIVLGDECVIKWNFVTDIKPTKSGKFLYTVSCIC